MTVAEFVAAFRKPITLRYFDLTPRPNWGVKQYPGPWRAAFSGHYKISDGMQSLALLDSDDRGEEGWGQTPDEAVTALAAEMVKKARESVAYHQEHGHKAETDLADLLKAVSE